MYIKIKFDNFFVRNGMCAATNEKNIHISNLFSWSKYNYFYLNIIIAQFKYALTSWLCCKYKLKNFFFNEII